MPSLSETVQTFTPPSSRRPVGRGPRWPVVVGAVAVVFFPALDGQILSWDDTYYLRDAALQSTSCFLERLSWIFSSSYFDNYNPLHRAGYWLQLSFFGRDGRVLHLTSLLFHCANSLLVYAVVRRLRYRSGVALFAALLFALHPSRAEVVAWISAQKDLGFTFFTLLGLFLYAPLLDSAAGPEAGRGRQRLVRLLGVGVCCLLALFYKSMAVVFPLLLLTLDLAWRRPWRQALVEKVPFLVAAAFFALLTVGVAPRHGPIRGDWQVHFATVLQAPWMYLRQVLWPLDYSARYWVPRAETVLSPLALCGLVAVAVAGVAVLRLAGSRHRREALLLLVWPAAAMLPVLNIVPIPIVVADRYLYLALLGPFIVIAGCWFSAGVPAGRRAPGTRASRLRVAAAAALLLGLSWLSFDRCGAFRDSESLWRRSFAQDPANPMVRKILAEELIGSAVPERATEALQLLDFPFRDGSGYQEVWIARSRAFKVLGRERDAAAAVDRAVGIARRSAWRASTALAEADRLASSGAYDEAHRVLDECDSGSSVTLRRLLGAHAVVSHAAGDDPGYLQWNARQIENDPFEPLLWHNREVVARRLGLDDEARQCARRFDELIGAR